MEYLGYRLLLRGVWYKFHGCHHPPGKKCAFLYCGKEIVLEPPNRGLKLPFAKMAR